MTTTILFSKFSNKISYFLKCFIIVSVLSNFIVIKIEFNFLYVNAAYKCTASVTLFFSTPVPGVSITVKELSP
jgi:hypothetical protein